MKSLNNYKGWLVLLLLTSVLNLSVPPTQTAHAAGRGAAKRAGRPAKSESAAQGESASYGRDRDGVPFALRADGTKGRFLSISSKLIKIEIQKGADKVGVAEFRRLPDNQLLSTFKADKDSESLSFRAGLTAAPVADHTPSIRLSIQYRKHKVDFTSNGPSAAQQAAPEVDKEFQGLVSDLRANEGMSRLLKQVQFFSSKTTLRGISPLLAFTDSCGWSATSCVASLVEYGLGAALIIEVCGVTVGVGCLLALAFHPVAGALVARHCADALKACGYGNTEIGIVESQQ
ncbi:MAG: hypothetical protein JOZ96_01060 [Acidobacteria bacterium]|nr:hypothetical protein [Acidobacteriota bacterium]